MNQKTTQLDTSKGWQPYLKLACIGTFGAVSVGCMPQIDGTDGTDPKPDGTYTHSTCEAEGTPPVLPEGHTYAYWKRVKLSEVASGSDLVCANNQPYYFFVQYHPDATDLVVTLEGGGACWDYATCNGQAGVLKANNMGPPPEDAMSNINHPTLAIHPQVGRIDNGVATNKYNQVYLPYCTADVFSGDAAVTYTNPENPSQTTTIQHRGRRIMKGVAEYLKNNFNTDKDKSQTGQLLTMGTSAGGVGTMLNYSLIREAVKPKCSAGINDAGPIFLPGSEQQGIVDLVLAKWNAVGLLKELDAELDTLPDLEINDNIGNLSHGLAKTYPGDRFMLSAFREDLNFSVFSFVGGGAVKPGEANFSEKILQKWDNELNRFKVWADNQPEQNWGYYFPAFRKDNCSHGVAITPISMGNDDEYRAAGLDGRAHGYHRTELGSAQTFSDLVWNEDYQAVTQDVNRRRHFGDALRQLLDFGEGADVPRFVGSLESGQLSFTNPSGSTSETWYVDGQDVIISDPQQWARDQMDPTKCTDPGNAMKCSCSHVGNYQPPN